MDPAEDLVAALVPGEPFAQNIPGALPHGIQLFGGHRKKPADSFLQGLTFERHRHRGADAQVADDVDVVDIRGNDRAPGGHVLVELDGRQSVLVDRLQQQPDIGGAQVGECLRACQFANERDAGDAQVSRQTLQMFLVMAFADDEQMAGW